MCYYRLPVPGSKAPAQTTSQRLRRFSGRCPSCALYRLHVLHLSFNSITDVGVDALAEAIRGGALPWLHLLVVDRVTPSLKEVCRLRPDLDCSDPLPMPCRDLPEDKREACAQHEIAIYGECKTCG